MPYDELGNYIPEDVALDEMRYELANKGTMPVRPGGSDVPYVSSEVPQTYVAKPPPKPASTATNFPQAVADKLGITALPQALMAMATDFPSEVAKGMGFGETSRAMQYQPTSRAAEDILGAVEAAPRVITGSHMGFGPIPEIWNPMARGVSPDDVRVMGANAKRVAGEVRDLPTDFSNAQSGVRRENAFGEPTIGVKAQMMADELGDTLARRQAAGKSTIPGVPDFVPETNLYAVKEKGGNWIGSKNEDPLTPLDVFKKPIQLVGESSFDSLLDNGNPAKIKAHVEEMKKIGYSPEQIVQFEGDAAVNNWVEKKLKGYVRNEMGTPTDPVRELHDAGISHIQNLEAYDPRYAPDIERIKVNRAAAGYPAEGYAKTDLGKHWELLSDSSIMSRPAAAYQKYGQFERNAADYIKDLDPSAKVNSLSGFIHDSEFGHLVDELKNAIDPASGLPAHLRLKPEALKRVTVPQAVERVHKINEWRTEQMQKAAKESLEDFPIAHEDPSGYRIHELKLPESKALEGEYVIDEGHFAKYGFKNPEGVITHREYNKPDIEAAVQRQAEQDAYAKLDKALKNEGEQMGHCVGGYTDSVATGKTRIFSLRDPKGGAHATVEIRPHVDALYHPSKIPEDVKAQFRQESEAEAKEMGYRPGSDTWHNYVTGGEIQKGNKWLMNNPIKTLNVEQIKGKGNVKVSEKYRGYIKDWLNKEHESIGQVADLDNVGLTDLSDPKSLIPELKDMYGEDGIHLYNAAVDVNPNTTRFMSREDLRSFIEKPNREQNLAKFLEPSVDKNIWYHTSNNPEIANSTIKPNVPNMGEHSSISLTATPESASSFDPKFKSFEKNPEYVENKAIYPVHVQVKKPFDYNNPKHFKELENYFHNNYNEIDTDQFIDELKYFKHQIKRNPELDTWETMESYPVQKAIRDLGYDGFYSQEDRNKNLAVFSSNQIKSKHGNEGTYDVKNHLMHKKTGGRVKMAEGGEVQRMNEGGIAFPEDIQRGLAEGRITQNQAEYIHNARLNPVPEHWGDHMSYQDRYNDSLEPKPKYVPPTEQEIRTKEFLDKQDPMKQPNVDMNREQLRKHALQSENPATFRSNPSRAGSGGGTQAGGPRADIKQIMNPRNITYRSGGSVTIDEMKLALIRNK